MLHAADGATWVATGGGGVNRIDADGSTITSFRVKDGLPSDEGASLWEDPDRSIWIGTNTSGLVHLDKRRVTVFGTAQGLPGLDVRAIYRDRRGTLWVATTAGLARQAGGTFAPVTAGDIALDWIVAILEDRTGTLWFASSGGVIRLRDGRFTRLTTKDGLASNKVMALHEDDRGSVWIGTGGSGLARLREDRLVSIRPYGHADGSVEGALRWIVEAVPDAAPDDRDRLRDVAVALFERLGPDDPLTTTYRRRLAAALY